MLLRTKQQHPWNRWLAARMLDEDRNRPLPWFLGSLLVTGWGALLRPVGGSGAGTKKLLRPVGALVQKKWLAVWGGFCDR